MPAAITVEARESASILEPGVYDAKIVDMIEETGNFGEQVKFVLDIPEILKENGESVQQWAWTSKTLSPKSKLWKWLKNVTGITPVLGEPFDVTGAMLGQPCQLVISFDDEKQRVYVSDMLGVKRATGRPSQSAARAAPVQGAQQAAPATDELCAMPKCGRPLASYDEDGTALCTKHGGKA